jgi:hypothetical protein
MRPVGLVEREYVVVDVEFLDVERAVRGVGDTVDADASPARSEA